MQAGCSFPHQKVPASTEVGLPKAPGYLHVFQELWNQTTLGTVQQKGSFQSLPDLQMAREQQGGQGRECPDKAAHKGLLFPRWEQQQPRLGLVGGRVGSEGTRGGARTWDLTCTQHRFHVPDRLYPLYTLARERATRSGGGFGDFSSSASVRTMQLQLPPAHTLCSQRCQSTEVNCVHSFPNDPDYNEIINCSPTATSLKTSIAGSARPQKNFITASVKPLRRNLWLLL